jgi:glycosyltransferase involved in cell wall biosynthesis
MAAYNSEETIRASAESVLSQTADSLELLIIDDASDRPTAEILKGVRDKRLRVLRHHRNRGVAAARNTGLRAARASLVAQIDGDDLWHEEYLASILPCFDNPAVGLAYSNTAMLLGGKPTGETYINDPRGHPVDTFPDLIQECPIPTPAVTMRTEAVRAVGGYAEWLWSHEDHHLYLKLARAGWRFAYVDEILSFYVLRPDSMSTRTTRVALDHLLMLSAFALRHPSAPGAVGEWRRVAWAAARRLGRELLRHFS